MKRRRLLYTAALGFLWSSCGLVLVKPDPGCKRTGCPDGERCVYVKPDESIVLPGYYECRPVPSPTPSPIATPTPSPVPTPTPTPVPTPTPAPLGCQQPSPGAVCKGEDPAGWCGGCWTCRDSDFRWKQHNKPCSEGGCDPVTKQPRSNPPRPDECSTCSERQEWEVKQGNWVRGPSGAPYAIFGCPPGVPEQPGCAGGKYMDKGCNLVDPATGRVLLPVESGYLGRLCVACPTPSPTPTPGPTPTPTPPPGAGDWTGRLLRMGAAAHGCQYRAEGLTKVFVNTTPRVARYTGDGKGDEQPREQIDPRGPVCTQAGPGWSGFDVMEQSSSEAYMCISVLPPGTYTFRACPQPDLQVADPGLPNLCGETRISIDSYGHATCLDGCAPYWKNPKDGSKSIECQGSPRASLGDGLPFPPWPQPTPRPQPQGAEGRR